ncbi:DUF3347 domain-containing protein [Haloflavibacter putidus]|uniref:DUF3347 domain-containing protein n=1 Tax=Haloflavibacter putidus TaxID=2576776 RepID=A0A507ZC91_9FLAO|nr:DUF3347 domain-containing protein [Haloflavibacter putidus]TQD35396.1 DUF3347 domain-containing protein [Haloflavibacter putidus]
MKTKFKTLGIIAIAALSFTACKNESKSDMQKEEVKQENTVKNDQNQDRRIDFRHEKEAEVFYTYLDIKNALVKTNAEETQRIAKDFADNHEEKSEFHEPQIYTLMAKIGELEDVEEQRELFNELSQKIEPFLQAALKEGEIFKQYCPMAFNDEGAFWFSVNEEIFNPYFGDKMLHCGSVQAIIK